MPSVKILPILFFVPIFSFGQNKDLFETELYSENVNKCSFISKYLNRIPIYQFYEIRSPIFYGYTYESNYSNMKGSTSYAISNDSLCQIYFSSLFPVKDFYLKDVKLKYDSLISFYKQKFDIPSNQENYFKEAENYGRFNTYLIANSTWKIGKDNFEVSITLIDGEKPKNAYQIFIIRYRNYRGDRKISSN